MEQRTSKYDFTPEEIQALLNYYKDHTAPQTADRFHTNYGTVWRLAKEAGFKKAKHSQAGFNPLENRLQKMTGRRFILAGLGWTVEVKGYELSEKEVTVLVEGEKAKVKPRVYKRKGALTKLDEDFLRMER